MLCFCKRQSKSRVCQSFWKVLPPWRETPPPSLPGSTSATPCCCQTSSPPDSHFHYCFQISDIRPLQHLETIFFSSYSKLVCCIVCKKKLQQIFHLVAGNCRHFPSFLLLSRLTQTGWLEIATMMASKYSYFVNKNIKIHSQCTWQGKWKFLMLSLSCYKKNLHEPMSWVLGSHCQIDDTFENTFA